MHKNNLYYGSGKGRHCLVFLNAYIRKGTELESRSQREETIISKRSDGFMRPALQELTLEQYIERDPSQSPKPYKKSVVFARECEKGHPLREDFGSFGHDHQATRNPPEIPTQMGPDLSIATREEKGVADPERPTKVCGKGINFSTDC